MISTDQDRCKTNLRNRQQVRCREKDAKAWLIFIQKGVKLQILGILNISSISHAALTVNYFNLHNPQRKAAYVPVGLSEQKVLGEGIKLYIVEWARMTLSF